MINESGQFRLRRKKVTLLVMGQSTEQGPVSRSDYAAYPNAFDSARNPGFRQKRVVPVANRGGYWPKVYDDLWDWGYDLDVINGAVGGASLLTHILGILQARQNSSAYYQRRASNLNYPDLGDFGDVIQITNGVTRHFVPTVGRLRQAFNNAPFPGVAGAVNMQDYVSFSQTTEASGASVPDISTVAIGQTIADGTLTLMRVDSTQLANESTFYPGDDPAVNGGNPNFNLFGIMGERSAGFGFDPLGIIAHAERMASSAAPAEIKIVDFSQGQSDLGTASATYQRACQLLANYFLRRGWIVLLGNTVYSPASAGSTTTNYGFQVSGVDAAIAALAAVPNYAGRVFRGANLYADLGTTGAMGGQRCTGSVSGTVLTVSALQANSGSGIAVGQNVWSGTTPVGIIVPGGTGAGGTGSYNLDRSATIAGGTALVCAGSGLQFDGIHFNGSMVAAAGTSKANAIKAVLPQLVA